MSKLIRSPKDFWSGAIFILFGLAAVVIGRDYSMGSAGRMGAAYFPSVLGVLLSVIGAVSIVRSAFRSGETLEKFAVKEIMLVLAAVLLFAVLMRGAGLVAAVMVLVMLSGFASAKFRWTPFIALSAGLALFSVLVFVKGLGLPMPMLGAWFGF